MTHMSQYTFNKIDSEYIRSLYARMRCNLSHFNSRSEPVVSFRFWLLNTKIESKHKDMADDESIDIRMLLWLVQKITNTGVL